MLKKLKPFFYKTVNKNCCYKLPTHFVPLIKLDANFDQPKINIAVM